MKFFERRQKAKLYQQWIDRAGLSPDSVPKEIRQQDEEELPLEESMVEESEDELVEDAFDEELPKQELLEETFPQDKSANERLLREEEAATRARTYEDEYRGRGQINTATQDRIEKKVPVIHAADNKTDKYLPGIGTAIKNLNSRQKRQLILFMILIVALTVFWVGVIALLSGSF